jgi:pimeloyl-ACP methyl ester carboxylesterase
MPPRPAGVHSTSRKIRTMYALLMFFGCAVAFAQDAIVLPRGTGPYSTSLAIEEWIDTTRPDPFNATHLRRIMISRFEPVPSSRCRFEQVPYMAPITAAVEDEILADYDYPTGLWKRFVLEVCKEKGVMGKRERIKKKWPLALFSPGLNTTRLFSSHFAQEIASHGFTVITIDHPYDTDIVEFPNGDVIFGGRVQKPENGSTESVDHALEVRAQDASFVLDRLRVSNEGGEKVVMFGHSFGGAAAATALLRDKRFRAGINIDGIMFGPVLNTTLGRATSPQAFALWGSEGHTTITDPSWTQFWSSLTNSAYVDYKKEFTVTSGGHGSYWDLNVLVDVAGIREGLSTTAMKLIGPIPGSRMWEIMGRYIPAYFWYVLGLKGEDQVLRDGGSEFPEVKILSG